MADKFINSTGLGVIKDWILEKLGLKADLVENPSENKLLICDANGQPTVTDTDLDTLLFDVDAGKNAFRLYDFNQSINITIPSVTSDVANTGIPNCDIALSDEMAETWAVASLAKFEIYNGGTRLNAFPVCSFSMNGQKILRTRMMVAGTASKAATKIQGSVLLKHR